MGFGKMWTKWNPSSWRGEGGAQGSSQQVEPFSRIPSIPGSISDSSSVDQRLTHAVVAMNTLEVIAYELYAARKGQLGGQKQRQY